MKDANADDCYGDGCYDSNDGVNNALRFKNTRDEARANSSAVDSFSNCPVLDILGVDLSFGRLELCRHLLRNMCCRGRRTRC